jgi:hypothetical protein
MKVEEYESEKLSGLPTWHAALAIQVLPHGEVWLNGATVQWSDSRCYSKPL